MKYQHDYSILTSMKNEAGKELQATGDRLTKQIASLDSRLGENTYGTLVGSIFCTLMWTAAFILGGILLADTMPGTTHWLIVIPSLLLVVIMLLRKILTFRYFGGLLSARSRLDRLRDQVSTARTSIVGDYTKYMASKDRNWRLPLSVGTDAQKELERVDTQLAGMQAVSEGGLSSFASGLYYICCFAWAIASYFLLFETGLAILDNLDFAGDANQTILIICAVISVVATIILARLLWASTGNQVTNVTLFGLLIGPAAFMLVILLALLIVLVASIVLSIAAVVLGAIFVFSCLCGG